MQKWFYILEDGLDVINLKSNKNNLENLNQICKIVMNPTDRERKYATFEKIQAILKFKDIILTYLDDQTYFGGEVLTTSTKNLFMTTTLIPHDHKHLSLHVQTLIL